MNFDSKFNWFFTEEKLTKSMSLQKANSYNVKFRKD